MFRNSFVLKLCKLDICYILATCSGSGVNVSFHGKVRPHRWALNTWTEKEEMKVRSPEPAAWPRGPGRPAALAGHAWLLPRPEPTRASCGVCE